MGEVTVTVDKVICKFLNIRNNISMRTSAPGIGQC